MVVQVIEPDEVIRLTRRTVAVPDSKELRDEAFLAALVRRTAGIFCPCSERTLARAIMESLGHLSEDAGELLGDLDDAIQNAMIAGDLLELSQVTSEDPNTKGTWVFAAPPAFVARPNGSVFFMGVVPDEPTPLPRSLASRIACQRQYRMIHPQPGENLPAVLRDLGVLELSEQTWLKLPKPETAKSFRDRLQQQLMSQGPSGDVAELLILDGSKDPNYYRGRWVPPKDQTGCFVARRPQAYGAALWGFAYLADGALAKFLDFPLKRDKWRGSDFAWHLQMAIDACVGNPQKYRRRHTPQGALLDFFSPLPQWADRRLAIVGRPAQAEHCLFTYRVPADELADHEEFLQSRLWLAPIYLS